MTTTTRRIGVIAAMPEEAEALFEHLDAHGDRVYHGKRDFLIAHRGSTEIIVVVSRVGKVSAAATAAELIVRFGVDELIVTGVAGGIGPGVEVGDVVVATELIHHDLDARPIWPRHVVPLLEVARFTADARLSAELEHAAREFLGDRSPKRNVHKGLVATGDVFVSSSEMAAPIRGALPDALCVEMEGAAVAQVAFEQGVPVGVVRAISDRADDDTESEYTASLAAFAAEYTLGICLPLIEREGNR
ncbi:MAG: 5'-methylthioadenosine/adenosylhomocysteine nucleosidase [Planctomycetota bacterium]